MRERLKQLRFFFGFTQERFASKIGKTREFIASVESGKCGISEKTIQDISIVFGINDVWLRDGIGPMFKPGEEKAAIDEDGIPARLKGIRKRVGLTQQQFADQCGCHKNQVYRIETKQTHPSEDFLKRVASTFNISYNWLMTGTGDMDMPNEALVDDRLIAWLKENPEIVLELRRRGGLD